MSVSPCVIDIWLGGVTSLAAARTAEERVAHLESRSEEITQNVAQRDKGLSPSPPPPSVPVSRAVCLAFPLLGLLSLPVFAPWCSLHPATRPHHRYYF